MSPSDVTGKLTLEIEAADPDTEIFVVNGDLVLEDRGVGNLTTHPLDPGIYKIKVRAGEETREEYVVLREVGQKVSISPFAFASPAPLAGTSKTHEYQVAAAEQESQRVHVNAGQGSWIFVFARQWTSPSEMTGQVGPTNPATGLSLRGQDGHPVADLATMGHVDSQASDPWAACNVHLDPGLYRLSLELPSGRRMEQTVAACPGWQTQVFLLQRDFGEGRRADLLRGSVLMARPMGFRDGDAGMRRAELARLALINRRKLFSYEMNQMLRDKFENPMLGIFGAHLHLLSESPDLDLLRTVVANLRWLLQHPHPDVEALALETGEQPDKASFAVPPMLRRSWSLVLESTIEHPALVPADSLAATVAQDLCSEEPWLIWNVPPPSAPAAVPDTAAESPHAAALAALGTAASRYAGVLEAPPRAARFDFPSPFKVVRDLRESAPAAEATPAAPALPAAAAATGIDQEAVGYLVRTLRLPRSSVETMIKKD